MSRIPVVERADAGPEVNASYDALEAMGFPLLNVLKMFGQSRRQARRIFAHGYGSV